MEQLSTASPLAPLRLRLLERPIDHVLLVILARHFALARADAAAHGDAGRVHGFRIAGDERMPPGEPASLGETAIGAGVRQPTVFGGALGREFEEIAHALHAVCIIGAPKSLAIEKPASGVGE